MALDITGGRSRYIRPTPTTCDSSTLVLQESTYMFWLIGVKLVRLKLICAELTTLLLTEIRTTKGGSLGCNSLQPRAAQSDTTECSIVECQTVGKAPGSVARDVECLAGASGEPGTTEHC